MLNALTDMTSVTFISHFNMSKVVLRSLACAWHGMVFN